jgi:hypothetical protein
MLGVKKQNLKPRLIVAYIAVSGRESGAGSKKGIKPFLRSFRRPTVEEEDKFILWF